MLTVTISVLPDGYGGISLELVGPAGSSIESTAAVESLESGGGVETTYVLEWPATVTATNGGGVLAVTSNNSVEGSTKTTVLPTVTGKSTALPTTTALSGSTSSALSSSSSSSKIQLCYDPNANSPPPCPSSTTPTPTPSSTPPSSGAIFNPPGATTVRSQASKLSLPPFFSLDAVRKYIKSKSEESNREEWTYPLLITSVFLLASSFFIFLGATLYLLNSIRDGAKLHDVDARKVKEALRIHGYDDAEIDIILAGPETRDDEHEHDDDDDEGAVDVGDTAQPETEIATPNTNITPITVVKGSARPLLEPRVVQKGEIRKVEGSARPWVKGKRTHSLWEEQRGRGVGMEGEGVGESGLEHVFVGAKD